MVYITSEDIFDGKEFYNHKTYLKFLEETFNVWDNKRMEYIPYKMEKWQKIFHSYSINVWQKPKNIFIVKSRGISYTTSSVIDLIITALKWDGIVIPLIAQRYDNAKEFIKRGREIIRNANIDIPIDNSVQSELRFENGSSIKPFPSDKAEDATRGLRTIRAMIDEAAMMKNLDSLLHAVYNTMIGNRTQVLIGSTFKGRNNFFYRMYEQLLKDNSGWVLMELPLFDRRKVDVNKDLAKQNLQPIVNWINVENVEKFRVVDFFGFMQEYMCDPVDETVSLFSYDELKEVMVNKNIWREVEGQQLFIGLDLGEKHLTAFTIFNKDDDEKWNMVGFEVLKNIPLNQQLEVVSGWIDDLLQRGNVLKVRVDSSGLGLLFYEKLKEKYEFVEGIKFTKPQKINMATIMKYLVTTKQIKLVNNPLLLKHFLQVRNDFTTTEDEDGHGDLFWSSCLAVALERIKENENQPAFGIGVRF
jgi:phage FluMu gp28-like protein